MEIVEPGARGRIIRELVKGKRPLAPW